MACCNGSGIDVLLEAKRLLDLGPSILGDTGENMVKLMFIGPQLGSVAFGGLGITPSGGIYFGGNNSSGKYIMVPEEDVQWLLNTGAWEKVADKVAYNLETPPAKVKLAAPKATRKAGSDVDDSAPVTA